MIEFASDGGTVGGYLATPAGDGGQAVLVIQEWWGLVPHIEDLCDRLAEEGFLALAPDLYHGESTTEPDEAGKLMMGLRLEQALKDMSGAVDELAARAGDQEVGVIGFCMGGGLALLLAVERPDAVKACVSFYGAIPWEGVDPDWSALAAPVQVHVGDKDEWAGNYAAGLEESLGELGKEIDVYRYEGADHAFFNDTRPEVYDAGAADSAFQLTLGFFRDRLG